MKNPLDEETKQEMQQKIEETMKTFGSNYTMSFKDSLINNVMKKSEEEKGSEFQLIEAPLSEEPLKQDFMIKLGAVRKNWKKRWFVASNEKDNFAIKYYATKEMKKLKGEINLSGYILRDFTDEEKAKDGDGIAMVKKGGREWKVRCVPDTPENKAAWKQVLNNACKKAKPPIGGGDEVAATAFTNAYSATRTATEIDCAEHPSGTEAEALSDLVKGALSSLIEKIKGAIPDGPVKNMMNNMAETGINTLIRAGVSAGWSAMKEAMKATRSILETGIKAVLGALNDAKAMLNEKAAELCSKAIQPIMDGVLSSKIQPILKVIVAPVSAGYVQSVKLFVQLGEKMRDETKANAGALEKHFAEANSKLQKNVFGALETLESALNTVLDALGDFPALDVVSKIRDMIVTLVKKGLATMHAAISKDKEGSDAAYTATLAKVIHDAKLFLFHTLRSVLSSVIKPGFDNMVKPLCLAPIAPVEELIPEPVKDFVSVEGIVEDLLVTTVNTSLDAVVTPLVEPEQKKLDELIA